MSETKREKKRENQDIKTNTRNEVRCRDGVTIKRNYVSKSDKKKRKKRSKRREKMPL